ncbi:MAG: M48 family metallopeptidase [Gammaproteobacteria bacterium]|nr:M48 family metallopeptidase [Gammaproteobacteria bacterium]
MSQSHLLQLDFPYRVIRSKRKSAAIHVRGGQVEVRIPNFVEDQWALEFLYSKRHWVKQKLSHQAHKAEQRPIIKHGASLLWQGQSKRIQLNDQVKGVQVLEKEIVIGAKDDNHAQAQLTEFFKQQAKVLMVKRTLEVAQLYGVSDQLQDVRLRRTKTKWGHCTSKGVIQYNWLILGAPLAVIDYLICHEVSHLIHPNHSQRFWNTVKRYCPDYKTHQAWLKQNSHLISWC